MFTCKPSPTLRKACSVYFMCHIPCLKLTAGHLPLAQGFQLRQIKGIKITHAQSLCGYLQSVWLCINRTFLILHRLHPSTCFCVISFYEKSLNATLMHSSATLGSCVYVQKYEQNWKKNTTFAKFFWRDCPRRAVALTTGYGEGCQKHNDIQKKTFTGVLSHHQKFSQNFTNVSTRQWQQ